MRPLATVIPQIGTVTLCSKSDIFRLYVNYMFVLFFWGVAQKYDPLQNVRLRLVFLHSLLG